MINLESLNKELQNWIKEKSLTLQEIKKNSLLDDFLADSEFYEYINEHCDTEYVTFQNLIDGLLEDYLYADVLNTTEFHENKAFDLGGVCLAISERTNCYKTVCAEFNNQFKNSPGLFQHLPEIYIVEEDEYQITLSPIYKFLDYYYRGMHDPEYGCTFYNSSNWNSITDPVVKQVLQSLYFISSSIQEMLSNNPDDEENMEKYQDIISATLEISQGENKVLQDLYIVWKECIREHEYTVMDCLPLNIAVDENDNIILYDVITT